MSKVLVDRELLRDSSAELSDWRMSFPDADSGMTDRLVGEIDVILARPAEAEGVEVVAYGMPNSAPGKAPRMMMVAIDIPGDDQYGGQLWEPLVRQSALSAVTAERDRLRELINSANGFQDALEREHAKTIDQLRATVPNNE